MSFIVRPTYSKNEYDNTIYPMTDWSRKEIAKLCDEHKLAYEKTLPLWGLYGLRFSKEDRLFLEKLIENTHWNI